MCLPSSRILRNCDEGHKRLYHMGKLETPRYSNAIFWLCRSWCNLIIVINCNSCRIKITFFRWFKRFKICKDEPLNYTQNALFKGTKMNQTKLKNVCITKCILWIFLWHLYWLPLLNVKKYSIGYCYHPNSNKFLQRNSKFDFFIESYFIAIKTYNALKLDF